MLSTRSPITIHKIARRDLLVLAGILLIAGVVRLGFVPVTGWSKDHSDMAMMALDIVDGKGIPLIGQPSSAVLPHSPFYIYILVLPYAITRDPILVTSFIAVLNMIGLAILWFIAYRYIGRTAAIVAGLAYAVHPWAVSYSTSIWTGDHRVPLFLLALLLGLYGFVEGKRLARILCLPVMLIALQVHYAAWALLPVYIWLVWIGRQWTSVREMAVSIVLGVLVVAPFAVGIVQTLTSRTVDVTPQTRELTSLRNLIKPYGQAVWLMTGLGVEQYTSRETADEMLAFTGQPIILWVFQGGAAALGIAAIWYSTHRNLALLILIWAFVPILVFTIPIVDVAVYYFLPSIPAYCLLAGVGVQWLLKRISQSRLPAAQYAVWGLFGVIFLTQGLFNLRSAEYADTIYSPSQFSAPTPVHYLLNVADELRTSHDVLVVTDSHWLEWSRTGSWVFAPFLRNAESCLRNLFYDENVLVRPAGPFKVAFAPNLPGANAVQSFYSNDHLTTVPLRQGEGAYSIFTFDAPPAWPNQPIVPVTEVSYTNGVALTGYRLDGSQLALEWKLSETRTQDYDYQVSFVDASGTVISEAASSFWQSKNWCAGDRVLTTLTDPVPDSAAAIRVSMATHRGAEPVQLANDDTTVSYIEIAIGEQS
jgi:hypothetical protein